MKKNNQTGKKKLSLEKLQMAKINNIKSIKGGELGINRDTDCEVPTSTHKTTVLGLA